MFSVRVPATSANLGPGFDCLGIALSLYDRFTVSTAEATFLTGVPDEFNNPSNLFLRAYEKTNALLGVRSPSVQVNFDCDIPVSRGLGSSAALITAGCLAANHLAGDPLPEEKLLKLAADLEGHPDNAAACLLGGLQASMRNGSEWITRQLPVDEHFVFNLLIPDFEVRT